MHINIESTKRRVRSIFIFMLIISLSVGIAPLYFARADVENTSFSIQGNRLYNTIRMLQVENHTLKGKLMKLQEENSRLKQLLSQREQENQQLLKKLADVNNKVHSLEKEINKLKAKNIYLEGVIGNLQGILKNHLKEISAAIQKLNIIKIDTFTITAYAPNAGGINCSGDCNTTAKLFKVSAIKDIEDITYCAVDPKVIPLYSTIIIQGFDKPCIAVDTGGNIKGYHIDIMMQSVDQALRWGKRKRLAIVIYHNKR